MGFIAAGIAVAAVGAGVSAYGSSQQAAAGEDAAEMAAYLSMKHAEEQQEKLDELTASKEEKLKDISSTLDRFGGGPSLQTEENLELLRKAQNDYLRLGAGDFGAFEDQLKDIMSSTVANTFGAGAPAGTFTQLSAQNVNALRQQGLNTGLQVSSFLGSESYNLLGSEFSIEDQAYQEQARISENELAAVIGAEQQKAQYAGANTMAAGSFLQTVGSSLASYGMGVNSGAIGGGGDVASFAGASARPSYAMPSGGGGGGGFSIPSIPSYGGGSSFVPSVGFVEPALPNVYASGGNQVLPQKSGQSQWDFWSGAAMDYFNS